MFIIYLFVFIFGTVIGSFLNVCIFRIPLGQSIAFPPSHCMECGKRLKWYDMFPIISWIILKGKCRFCGSEISYRYPLVEVISGIIFLFVYLKYGISFETIKYLAFVSLIIVIGLIDLDTTDVYTSTIIIGIVGAAILILSEYILYKVNLNTSFSIMDYILGGIIGAGFILLIIFFTHGMGSGDAEICLVCGLFLGSKSVIFMLLLSVVIGGIVGISLVLLGKRKRTDYIPFGPFIAVSAIVSVLFGQGIVNWYLGML
ncbi:prepilin peptidase [Clostridium guangxiense]|uniref:prepilin peptidase n=1 Tax=Clostridium guangxiense TaxID=1662055 RepID=UPI001E2EBF05|nr:A24 family peptidase [Clostridium guangxiense]MCD2346464.1 prepilin peptidase [Clostridium guangxiense]